MRRLFAVLVLLALLVSAAPVAAQPDGPVGKGKQTGSEQAYIVQMLDDPAVSYRGGISGYKATAPAKGQKIDPTNTAVIRYQDYLTAKHDSVLNSVGGGRKLYSYTTSFNGFAAVLSAEQAAQLRQSKDVLYVSRDEMVFADTSSTPAFLGLSDPGGLWDMLGGVESAGEDIIIGVVDSGIWPEHPSFSDRTGSNGNDTKDDKLDYQQIPGWHGKCVPGEDFDASLCNQKLIGAQYFNQGFGGDAGVDALLGYEFTSARDFNGHGTHTASTAGGNAGVAATGPAEVFGAISGMAPRARIAAYKALWHQIDTGSASGFTSDLVAAIDQAVEDGVDVINYSISGSRTNFMDPVMVSFLFAADAGVFVAASAGNSGPATATVAHPGPWVTTVAAGTHNRDGQGSVTLGNGVTYYGASVATAVGPAPLVNSEVAGLPDTDATEVALCFSGTLDPAVVTGKIVVCDRGVNARVDKSLAVQMAGGVGMILANTSASSLNADFHFVPTVHISHLDRAAVKAYAATEGATATINQATIVYTAPAPLTASFSSRGPLVAGNGDLLKPDVIAPGQDILAAVAPPANSGRLFDLYSGTSMSSPHVAGLGALLKDLHPDWSPMMIKSALMTTGYDVLDNTGTATKIFRQGAGHVLPNSAADPGLVFNAGWNQWLAFLCGSGQLTASYCPSIRIDMSDLNVASIAIGDLAGTQTVKRTLTNVSGRESYTVTTAGLAGLNVSVAPAEFTLNPGESVNLNITFTRTTAALNTYAGGYIVWSGSNGHQVRIPVVIRPVALAAPAQVTGTGGPISYQIGFGYTGPFTAAPGGLYAATRTPGSVTDDPTDTFEIDGPGTVAHGFVIPAGTRVARFSLFDEFVTAGGNDLDLYVTLNGTIVGSSGSGTSTEEVTLINPAAGEYVVWVHGWGVVTGTADYTLFSWLVDGTSAGNMAVDAPTAAVLGTTATVNLTFSGLAPAEKYLGVVYYSGVAGMNTPTIVSVNTP
jgi:hypothetical protein